MKSESPHQHHIHRLIENLHDQTITPDQLEELYELFRSSAEARNAYWDHIKLASLLQIEAKNLAEQGDVVPLPSVDSGHRRSLMARSFSIAAAAAIIALVTHFFLLKQAVPYAHYQISDGTSHSVIQGDDSVGLPPSVITEGSQVIVESGELTMTLPDSTTLVIQGPASLHVSRFHNIDIQSGKIWASSPSGNEPLTLTAGNYSIEDIGTKFGVIAKFGKPLEVHLIEGTVNIYHKGEDLITLDKPEAVAMHNEDNSQKIALNFGPFTSHQEVINIDFACSRNNHSVRAGEANWNQLHTDENWPRQEWGGNPIVHKDKPIKTIQNSRGENSPVGVILIPNKKISLHTSFAQHDSAFMFGDPLLDDFIHLRKNGAGYNNLYSQIVVTGLDADASYTLKVFSAAK